MTVLHDLYCPYFIFLIIALAGTSIPQLSEELGHQAFEPLTSALSDLKVESETKKRYSAVVGSGDRGAVSTDLDRSEESIRGMKVPKTMPIDPLIAHQRYGWSCFYLFGESDLLILLQKLHLGVEVVAR